MAAGPLLIYSTADPQAVRSIQAQLGVEQAGALVEQALAAIARGLVALGVRQLVVAGGETSGACVQALEIAQLRIGAPIDPGVPWCHAGSPLANGGLHVALKSGVLESSNVDPSQTLVQMIQLSRQYELQIRSIKSADENAQAASRLLQMT